MTADSSPRIPSEKRAGLPGCAASIFQLLRLFWVTELILLLLVSYGLIAGWSTPREWSDGFFLAAALQVIIAATSMLAPAGDALDAAALRYIPNANISDTREKLFMDTLRMKKFGVRALFGALLMILISAGIVWL